MALGVPILKHFRVIALEHETVVVLFDYGIFRIISVNFLLYDWVCKVARAIFMI